MAEAYVIDAIRTPMGAYRGDLSALRPDDLAAHLIAALVKRADVDPERITDVYLGAANQARRGQPRRSSHGGAFRRPTLQRARSNGEPPLRIGARGHKRRGARRQAWARATSTWPEVSSR